MVKIVKDIWVDFGCVEVIVIGGRRSVLVDVINLEKYGEVEG